MDDQVGTVRAFNRRYTEVIGVLQEGLVDTPYSLTEARVVFELAQADPAPVEVLELRRTLDLDPGYLSRLLARFEADGLVVRERSSSDARRQLVRLTEQGVAVARMLDERSERQIKALLDGLPVSHRERMVSAMRTIHEILDADHQSPDRPFTLRPAGPGDYGWVIQQNGAIYAAQFGWDSAYEALVARIVADYIEGRDEKRENAWIADLDGRPVGCVFCVREDDNTARLRLLLVDPSARGLGIGSALVDECLRFATEVGYRDMVLWTNDVLVSARHIYERAGFTLTESNPHHSFGHDLTGQTWHRPLHS